MNSNAFIIPFGISDVKYQAVSIPVPAEHPLLLNRNSNMAYLLKNLQINLACCPLTNYIVFRILVIFLAVGKEMFHGHSHARIGLHVPCYICAQL